MLGDDGTYIPDTIPSHLCTDYIPVKPLTHYIYSITYTGEYAEYTHPRKAFVYNSSKETIGQFAYNSSNNTFTTDATAAYVRVNVNTKDSFTSSLKSDDQYKGLNKDLFDNTFTEDYKIASSKTIGEVLVGEHKSSCVVTAADYTINGLLDSDGVFTPDSIAGHLCTDYIWLPQNIYFILNFTMEDGNNVPRHAIVYNSDKTKARSFATGVLSKFVLLTGDERYVRFNVNTRNAFTSDLYPIYKGKDGYTSVKDNAVIPQLSRINTGSTIMHRRPLVSFTLDGDYDMNEDFIELFEKYELRIGLAIGYNGFGRTNSLDTYLDWCNNRGHEMLAYGVVPLPEDSTKTIDEADEIIRAAKYQLIARGFNIYGFVGSTGNVAVRYRQSVKKIFEYGATKANTYGNRESCIFFSTDDPCETWRYSMQTSTLAEMKAAVDRAEANNGLLQFYTHAESENIQHSTLANVEELIKYIKAKNIEIMIPHKAFSDYYTIRREDIIS